MEKDLIKTSAKNRSLKNYAEKAKNINEESVTIPAEELKRKERDEFEAKCHQMGKEKEQINNGW